MLKNKRILLGITGGIAAYKAVELTGKFIKCGASVKTIMTKNACEFITPLTVKSITHQAVITKMFDAEADIEHISLADWADIIVLAPATANIIGKVASGIADDLLSTTIMATQAPILFVPSMNVHMFENPILQDNITKLSKLGYLFMEPEQGMLACGYEGKGRFPAVDEIVFYTKSYLHYQKDFTQKKILITAGATRENIDPMRFITNFSSGKMGLALARAAHIRGADVTLISANLNVEIPYYLNNKKTSTAEEMFKLTVNSFTEKGSIFMVAAVSDFTPSEISKQKIKKSKNLNLEFNRTKDILAELGKLKSEDQILVGFAAESQNIEENARKKLEAKNLDFIVANNLDKAVKDETEVIVIGKERENKIAGDKFSVAHQILDLVFRQKK
ncbi:MAG: bifunctional phosphopantothenoylcysteine decarboxylase/phosphopantothenate--cysteine ligase CoaBC [Armatimonadetes bacterium]|nr:bifunctional phosphopantothenoylcysteine decarboxylase/phosphopantothenate--cysteine ligase CoaBC [Armatimonadota bacterium]